MSFSPINGINRTAAILINQAQADATEAIIMKITNELESLGKELTQTADSNLLDKLSDLQTKLSTLEKSASPSQKAAIEHLLSLINALFAQLNASSNQPALSDRSQFFLKTETN